MLRIIFIVFAFNFIFADDLADAIDSYLQGNRIAAEKGLKDLQGLFKRNEGAIYLKALMTDDIGEAMLLYRKLAEKYPENQYADDALMKLCEIAYSQGLYIKCSERCDVFLKRYPKSALISRAVHLHLNSLLNYGKSDSAKVLVSHFQTNYPNIPIEPRLQALIAGQEPDLRPQDLEQRNAKPVLKPSTQNPSSSNSSEILQEQFAVQLGAFRKIEGAMATVSNLNREGYEARIVEQSGIAPYCVWLGHYANRGEAEMARDKLKNKFSLEGFVVKTN